MSLRSENVSMKKKMHDFLDGTRAAILKLNPNQLKCDGQESRGGAGKQRAGGVSRSRVGFPASVFNGKLHGNMFPITCMHSMCGGGLSSEKKRSAGKRDFGGKTENCDVTTRNLKIQSGE